MRVPPMEGVYDCQSLRDVGHDVDAFLRRYREDATGNGSLIWVELDQLTHEEPETATRHADAIAALRENCGPSFRMYYWW